jgi:MYXO-CTERM domain-containing protein
LCKTRKCHAGLHALKQLVGHVNAVADTGRGAVLVLLLLLLLLLLLRRPS